MVIGAASATGRQILANVRAGGFRGSVVSIDDFTGLDAMAQTADLAVVAADPLPELLPKLAAKGIFAVIVVCEAEWLADPGRWAGVRVLGPGSFGICVPAVGLNASLMIVTCEG